MDQPPSGGEQYGTVHCAGASFGSPRFTSEAWTGTVTVTRGTGTLAKASGKKGVLKCASGDAVHLTCTEKLKLTQL
ncbi:MAG TPA: hypothetical protein VLC49_07875 [Solirubrobacteraceae bacterium]|nr:hypothetical protein [Solirubrobacteraceae bacterium]